MNNILITGILGIVGMLGLYYVNKESPEQTQVRQQSLIRKQIGNNPNTVDIDYNQTKSVDNPMEQVQIFGGTKSGGTKSGGTKSGGTKSGGTRAKNTIRTKNIQSKKKK